MRVFRSFFRKRNHEPIRRIPRKEFRPAVESLEDRIMLAVMVPGNRVGIPAGPSAVSLANWSTGQIGGEQPGRGSVTINGTSAILREGTSFEVFLKKSFVIGPASSRISFNYVRAPQTAATPGVRDAFEVAFVNAAGESLVPTIGPGQDAFFNETRGVGPTLAPGVLRSGKTVTVSLAGIPPGVGTLIFRLVNNNADTDHRVTISKVRRLAGGAVPSALGTAAAAFTQRDIDFALLSDVTGSFTPHYGRTRFNDQATVLTADLSIKGDGTYLINAPLLVGIRNISDPGVVMTGADGDLPDGTPYYDYTDLIGGPTLAPGATTASRAITFLNPTKKPFTYELVVLGRLNQTPEFTSQAGPDAQPARTYVYHATARDADSGDALRFSKLGGPTGLLIDATTGTATWTPSAGEVGTHSVILRVDDDRGGVDTQEFTITVAAPPPNRPPIFTSTPIVDAGVAAAFQRIDIPVGDGPAGVAVGDFKNNGVLSVVTANTNDQNISFAAGVGAGAFDPFSALSVGEPPPDPDQLFVMPEMLPLTFPPPNSNASGVFGVAKGDFNLDGNLDVATTVYRDLPFNRQYWLTTMLGNGDGTFQDPVDILQLPSVGYGVLARDFDEDGTLDLVVAMHDRNEVWYFNGLGDGTFDAPVAAATATHPVRLQTDDLDGDGHLDLAIYSGDSGFVSILNGDGQGSFGNLQTISTGVNGWDLAIGDIDGQNGNDIVTVSHDERRIRFFTNDGTGHFAVSDLRIAGSSQSIRLGDFNSDGKTDIIATMDFGRIAVFLNNGDGTFGVKNLDLSGGWAGEWKGNTSYQTPNLTVAWFTDKAPIDIDGDGQPDFLFGTWGRGAPNVVTIGQSNGDGTFVLKQYVASAGSGVPNKTLAGTYTGAVIAGDFNNDGVQDIMAGGINDFNPTRPGGVSLLLGTTPGAFASPRDYFMPRDVETDSGFLGLKGMTTIGDFNEDGIPDAAILTSSLSFAPGLGDGTFGRGVAVLPRVASSVFGVFNSQIRSADFDRDGHLDVVWLAPHGTAVALGNGAGGFSVLQVFPWQPFSGGPNDGTTGGQNLAVGDLNGDLHPDVVVRTWNYNSLSGNVEIWLYDTTANGGIGGFTYLSDAGSQMLLGRTPDDTIQHENGSNILLGDFDNDNKLDLIIHAGPVGAQGSPGFVAERLFVWKGKHQAGAADASDLFDAPVNANPDPPIEARSGNGTGSFWETTAGDFNNDGNLDLAGVGIFATWVLLGNGDHTFGGATRYDYGHWAIVNADLDRDGDLDLVVNHDGFGPNAVRRGRGDGTFGPLEFIADPQGRGDSIVVHDLNGDGRLDLFESDSGNSAGAYNRFTVWLQPLPGLQAIATGDVNGDGKKDILAVNQANDRLKVLTGNGDDTFNRLHDTLVGRGPVALALGDLNRDQKLDAVTANGLANTVSVLLGRNDGTFARADIAAGNKPSSVALGDINGDLNPDLVVANRGENTLFVYLGNGDGAFAAPMILPSGAQPSSVILEDLDGDGKLDLVVANEGNNTATIFRGNGDGTFAAGVSFFVGQAPRSLAAGDINGDGRPDLVVANTDDDQVAILLNQSNLQFSAPIPIRTAGDRPVSVQVEDMNGDGKDDIIVANEASDTATVLLNRFGLGAPYTYQAAASDPDADPVAFTLQNGPAGMSMNATGLVTWFPTSDQIGPNAVTIQADDGRGGVSTQGFVVNVRQTIGNQAPIIVSVPTTALLTDQAYSHAVSALDADGDPLQFSLTTAPDGMTIDGVTGEINWDPRGGGLSFDGNDRVVIPDSPTLRLTNLTLEGWFKFDTDQATQILAQKSIVNAFFRASYQLWFDAAARTLNAGIGRDVEGFGVVSAAFTPVLGRWYHFAFTFDDPGNVQLLYIDGAQVGTSVNTRSIQYTADALVLGQQAPDHPANFFRGTMDEIRLWDFARSQSQIQADMGRRLTGNEPGLAAYYPMDEAQAAKVHDATPNHNDGTLGDSGIGTRVPTWVPGVSPLGPNDVTVRVEDGRGGFDEQSFTLTITNDTPAGISGIVFDDVVGTPPLSNRTAYIDLNQNGIRDLGEPADTTDPAGLFHLTGLPPGTYRPALEGQPGWTPTTPSTGAVDITRAPGQGIAQIDQYASSVIAFSSQYSSPGYGAIQVLGAPNVFTYGDSPNAWTTSGQNSGTHFLTVGYDTPVLAESVTVRETLGNGFVTQIDLLDVNDVLHTVWTGVDPSVPGAVADFRVTFPRTDYPVQGVKVYVNTDLDGGYEEIDAISLHGLDPTQLNNFGVHAVTTGQRGPAFVGTATASAQVGVHYRYQSVVTNPDGRPLSFELVVHPDGMVMDPRTGVIAWVPSGPQVGPQRGIARVMDDRGLVALLDFTITVTPANTAPIISSTPPGPAIAELPYEYRVQAQDAEGGALTFTLDAPSLALGMTIDANGVLRWTPGAAQVGSSHPVVITVADPHGAAAAQAFNLPVVAGTPNTAPVITATPRTFIGLANTYFYDVQVTDPDGDPLLFDLPTHPIGMTIDSTGRITWTPHNILGPNAVTVSVSDGRSPLVEQSFTLTVASQNPNRQPAFTSLPVTTATAGEIYAYDAMANDPDGDPLEFSLDQAPAGMSIQARTGALRWSPTLDQLGQREVAVRVIDAQGAAATQTFTVTVRGAHVPPIISSAPPTTGSVAATYLYPMQVIAPQGVALAFSLPARPAGMVIDAQTGLISWTPTAGQVGSADVTVRVSDGAGGEASQRFVIEVAAAAPNAAPRITSMPPLVATAGVPFTYSLQAVDPDNGPSPLNFKKLIGPAGLTVDANTGLVEWSPLAADIGSTNVTLAAFDGPGGTGAAGLQTFSLQVTALNHPPAIASTATPRVVAGNTYRYDVLASDADGDALFYALTAAPAGMTVDRAGRIRWATDASVLPGSPYPVTLEVTDPRGARATQSFNVTVVPDTLAPQIGIALNPITTIIGGTAFVRVVAYDNVGVTALDLTVNGTPIALDGNGQAALDTTAAGIVGLTASARDVAGNVGTANATFRVIDPNVVNAPNIAITAPAADGTITTFTNVVGTVQDPNLLDYELFLRPADAPESAFKKFAGGATNVINGTLGVIDPTLLSNDSYVLRLVATNAGGLQSILDQNVSISGELKLGNFQLTFDDMSIPLGGIPITVTRIYDSLAASRKGDFGFGWRLDFRDTDLRTSLPKSGAEIVGLYTPFQFGTKVYLTLPGGQREGFTFTPQQHGLFNLVYFTPNFTPDPGVTHQLSVRNVYLTLGADGNFYTLNGQLPYNPATPDFGGGYTLTSPDGIAYRIDGETGLLTRATDRNQNTLTYSDAGIASSSGANVAFHRDAQGRIVGVTDPAGQRVTYAYNTAGDLISVTDRTGNVTQIQYDPALPHFLTRILDPLGRAGVRSVYDAQGRLNRTIDALGNAVQITYDPNNSLQTIRDPLGNPTTYEYDVQGNIVARTDALGGVMRSTYDAGNNPITVVDPLGQTTTTVYDAAGNVLISIDPLGQTNHYTYNAFGQLLTATDARGATSRYEYDAQGNLVAIIDAFGRRTDMVNNSQGNPLTVAGADGGVFSQVFDANGRAVQETDRLGAVATFARDANGRLLTSTQSQTTPAGVQNVVDQAVYDAEGRVLRSVDALGNVTQYQYDTAGNRTLFIDALSRRTQFAYDADNRLIRTVYPDGTSELAGYDAAGNQTSFADRAGRVTTYQYDALNRRVATIYPDATPATLADNPRTQVEYDTASRVTAEIDELGQRTEYGYDAAGNQILIRNALGNETRQSFDANGNLLSLTDALGHTTRFTYDEAGRLLAALYADGTNARIAYDDTARTLESIDALGSETGQEFDAEGRVVATVDALGNRTTFAYDELGNLVAKTDPLGRTTRYEYDALGRKTATVLPLGQRSTHAYDAVGNRTATVDANGSLIRYTFDLNDRLVSKRFPDGTSVAITYTATGQRRSVTDSRGVTNYTYDARDRLLQRTDPDGSFIRYAYDKVGNVVSITTPAGAVVYTYDAVGQMKTVTAPDGGITRYGYDAVGNLVRTDFPDGTIETRTYNARDQLTSQQLVAASSALLASFGYTRDDNGNVLSRTENTGRVVSYAYDDLGRLLTENVTDGTLGNRTIHYTYDAVGNRLTRDDAGAMTVYVFDANDRLTSETTAGNATVYTFDANGNTLTAQSTTSQTTYFWDFENRLRTVIVTGAGATRIDYRYDVDGNRVSQKQGAQETRLLVDTNRALPHVVEEYTTSPARTITTSYVVGLGLISERIGATAYYHTDHLGSTRLLTIAGAVSDTYVYDAFGRMLHQTGLTPNAYLFAAEPRDSISEQYYLRERYLSVSTGRFLTMDPLLGTFSEPLSMNRYVYAASNPVNRIDPTGQASVSLMEFVVYTSISFIVSAAFDYAAVKAKEKGYNKLSVVFYVASFLPTVFSAGGVVKSLISKGGKEVGKAAARKAAGTVFVDALEAAAYTAEKRAARTLFGYFTEFGASRAFKAQALLYAKSVVREAVSRPQSVTALAEMKGLLQFVTKRIVDPKTGQGARIVWQEIQELILSAPIRV
ncbi:MAG: VCBS repeat-containing protein [Planctomycetes bacterium]|nr:VCBS repeat-containing protein [Planctomycetota bacterium]